MLAKAETIVRPMRYPVLTGGAVSAPELVASSEWHARLRELEVRLAEQEKQFAGRLESAHREGFERGREQMRAEQGAWKKESATGLTDAIEDFHRRREEYFARVEHEVVRLALAIAERVLRREAQMDPLLLAGAVRVALGQIADSTEVRLRVPAEQQELWTEMVRLMPGATPRPAVVADPERQSSEVLLETEMGTLELGVRAQLAEIERGFFDLLEARQAPDAFAQREQLAAGSPR